MFVASVSFFLTFATVRGMVFAITHNIPPFHYVIVEGKHIHHLVFGIVILLLVGYGWLCEVGNGSDSSSILAGRAMSLLYGLGAALTLDEFALWLNLKDVYFVREGRSSIDAVVLFGSLLAVSAWGAPLFSDRTDRQARLKEPERVLKFRDHIFRRNDSERRKACKLSPEWIWAELPSTTPW